MERPVRRHLVSLQPRSRRALLGVLLAVVSLAGARTARADDVRMVGPYRVSASFASAPVYPLEPNALVFRITDENGAPVTGAENSLVLHIGEMYQATETLPLEPLKDQPGMYQARLMLPRAGIFSMQLLGTLGSQKVEERFITEQNGLDKVITRGRVYPRGAGWVVLFTISAYLVGVAWLVGRAGIRMLRQRRMPRAGSV